MRMIIVITAVSVLCLFRAIETNAQETLRLGVLVSQEADFDFSGLIPAMELALETVENDTTLPFNFSITLNDSMCQAATGIRSFIEQIFTSSTENLIMLIGSDCSVATEPVAELAIHWNLVQISPASTSPRLSNNKTFPHFVRTVSSDAEIVVGIVHAMKQFQWSRIALITQSENIFTFIAARLKDELAASNLNLIREFTFNSEENASQALESYSNSPARIVFLNMYQEHAVEVLCEAYQNNMFYPDYVWIFFNWYTDNWWLSKTNCSRSDLQTKSLARLIRNSLVLDHYPRIEDEDADQPNVGNIDWHRYVSEHEERFKRYKNERFNGFQKDNNKLSVNDSAYGFDAIWAAALSLNRTEAKLKKMGLSLKNFSYNDEYNISDMIYKEALNLKFFGLTGNVSFLPNGDRLGKVRLLQYREDADKNLAKIPFAKIEDGTLKYDNGESDSTVYPGGIPQDEEEFFITLPLFVIYLILAVFGIIFAVGCLIFNLWYRNQKLVKLSSPYVNTMIIAGAVIFYVMVILFGVDENVASHSTVNGLCHARIWLVAIGFSLLYGTIFAKTWRIYYIFNYAKPCSKVEVKDIYLFGIVGILVLADIVFLIPPTIVSSARLRREYEEVRGTNDDDLPAVIKVCTSDSSLEWVPVLFAIKGFVLLIGVFLAFETRKVKIKSLNDSRFIGMSVYGTVIVSIALTPIGFVLENYPNLQYGIVGIMVLLSTSLILGIIFVTKGYKVYQDPKGTRTLDQSKSNIEATYNNAINNNDDNNYFKKKIISLNEEIKDLSDELATLKMSQSGIVISTEEILAEDTTK